MIHSDPEAYYSERFAAWKIYLPVLPEYPILAIGFQGSSLLSLSRTWHNIHVYHTKEFEFGWACDQVKRLNLTTDIRMIDEEMCCSANYQAIAVSNEVPSVCAPSKMIGWLKPGGAMVWVGQRFQMPKSLNLMRHGFGLVRRYAVLPPSGWKLIIPINDGKYAKTGLKLYQGNRLINRILSWLCRFASELGCQGLLGIGRQIVFATKPGFLDKNAYILQWIGDLLGSHVGDVTIYPGTNQTPGHRKITMQVLDDTGKAIAILKIADTKTASAANRREACVLELLRESSFLRDSIPKLIATKAWGGFSVQVHEAIEYNSREYSSEISTAHLNFLHALSHVGRREMKLSEWHMWTQIVKWSTQNQFASAEETSIVRSAIQFCWNKLCNTKLVFHRIHGDFTPWNVFLKGSRLMVVDWEDSELEGLPFFDIVHFTLRKRSLLENKPLTLRDLFSSTAKSLGIDELLSEFTRGLPLFMDLSCEQYETFLRAHLILCFALRSIRDN